MLEGHGPPDIDVPGGPWVLNTFENSTPGSVKPLFKLVAMIQIGLRIFRASIWSDGSPLSSISCFHPSEPVLAVCASGRTSLWKFNEAGESHEVFLIRHSRANAFLRKQVNRSLRNVSQ
jgi:hypothetical protein